MNKELGFTLEGECFVGKSETLRSMQTQSEQNIFVVPEYFEVGRLTSSSRVDSVDVHRIQDEIIGMEKRRTEMAVSYLASHPAAELGFDRSYLSCLAFEQSVRQKGYLDGYYYLLERLIKEFEGGNIILPVCVVHLTAKPDTIEARRSKHLKKGNGDVSGFLRDPEVRHFQTRFINEKGVMIYDNTYFQISTDDLLQEQVAKICLNYTCGRNKSIRINLSVLYE